MADAFFEADQDELVCEVGLVDEEKNAARYLTFQILSNLCEDCECNNSIHS